MRVSEFRELVERALSSGRTLCAFLTCDVSYSGRAETYLAAGERLLVIKADSSVQVHQATGSLPINYMKQGSIVTLDIEGDVLLLTVQNQKEKAWLELRITAISACSAQKLEDSETIDLAGTEKDMSDWIRDNPQCISPDFRPISREEQTDVGFIDVYGHDGNGTIVIVECKRVTASLAAVDQLRRYVERVRNLKGAKEVRGVLAAPGITKNAREMLATFGLGYCAVDPPKRLERWRRDQTSIFDY